MHMLIALKCIALCLITITGCQTMANAAGHATGDTRTWEVHRVQVDDKVVEFKIPPNESKEFPGFAIPQKLDLHGGDVFSETLTGPSILNRYWDYRASRFVAVDGTLHAYIGIHRSTKELIDEQAIKNAIEEGSKLFAIHVAKGRQGLLDPPVRYNKMTIGGKEWWQVDYRISGRYYITSLDGYHYLKASVNAGQMSDSAWRADSQAAANAILHSIRIVPALR